MRKNVAYTLTRVARHVACRIAAWAACQLLAVGYWSRRSFRAATPVLSFTMLLLAVSPLALFAQTQCFPWSATINNGSAYIGSGTGYSQMEAAEYAVNDLNARITRYVGGLCAGLPYVVLQSPVITSPTGGYTDLYAY